MKLVDKSGKEVALPCTLPDFRGDMHTLTSAEPPRHPGSTGRVYCGNRELFPSVFDLKWEQS